MRLGETLTINIAGQAVVLRPTLRHALELERRPGGITAVGMAVDEHSLTAISLIIRHHTNMQFLESRVFDAGLEKLAPIMSNYLLALLGVDPFDAKLDKPAKRSRTKPKPHIETLTNLFGIATGWLGWSPKDAWDASPMEVIAAYKGRLAMLKAIFGGDDTGTPERSEPQDLDAKARAVFASLGTVREEA